MFQETMNKILENNWPQLLMIAVGILLILFGWLAKDRQLQAKSISDSSRKNRVAGSKSNSASEPDSNSIEIPYVGRFPRSSISWAMRLVFFGVGLLSVVVGLLWIVIKDPISSQQSPSISLVGARYIVDDYNPRLLDLQSVETEGIALPADQGHAVKVFDITATIPKPDSNYMAQVDIYADDEKIGSTPPKPLVGEQVRWESVNLKNYQDDTYSDSWSINPGWKNLRLELVTYLRDKPVSNSSTIVQLNSQGGAWLIGPPYVKFASLVYTINDGPPLVVDMRDALDEKKGFNVKAGDLFTLQEVWYQSTDGGNPQKMQFEAYWGNDQPFDEKYFQHSPSEQIEPGLHKLSSFTPMTWTVASDRENFSVKFARDDDTIMDPLRFHISSDASFSGLVRKSDAVLWPFDTVRYVDFETPDDLAGWVGNVGLTTAKSFTGNHALAITTTKAISPSLQNVFVEWKFNPNLQAEAIVGQIYWPDQPGIMVSYAQICHWECVVIPVQTGRWNTFVMDFSEKKAGDKQANEIRLDEIKIQAQVNGVDEQNPYAFYVDGLQIFYPQQ
jgi:hypothetical protein